MAQGKLIRQAAVAGQFYDRRADVLRREVRDYLGAAPSNLEAVGVVAPHAGYVYSGAVAGELYGRLRVPERVVVLAVNHGGWGAPAALIDEGAFRIPTGDVPVDAEAAAALLRELALVQVDPSAHRSEHSLEVQLPFLLERQPLLRIVPLVLSHLSRQDCQRLGQALAAVVGRLAGPTLIVASSDMSHEPRDATVRARDPLAIERLLALDAAGLYDVVVENHISMCGFIPATVMLHAAQRLGARQAELVRYATSADVAGDIGRSVGYAALAVCR